MSKWKQKLVARGMPHLEDVPEAEGHLADGLLGRVLTAASRDAEDDGHQSKDDLPAFVRLQRPVDQHAGVRLQRREELINCKNFAKFHFVNN